MGDEARQVAAGLGGTARGAAAETREALASAPRHIGEQTQGNPLAAGLVAFGLGLVAGSLVPASEAEAQAARKVREGAAPLVDEARQMAATVREDLRGPARESVAGVRESAMDAGQQLVEHGREAVTEVIDHGGEAASDVMAHGLEAARDEGEAPGRPVV